MRLFIDSSVFLKLLLNEPGADAAQEILENIEYSKSIGYVTPMVLEEVSFKLIYAKLSEALNTRNVWKIREALRLDRRARSECCKVLRKFLSYIEYLYGRGLRIENVMYSDWVESVAIVEKYGLLPADALHVAVALRLKVNAIATFDEDFKAVREVKIIP